jgi:hypothetical protein
MLSAHRLGVALSLSALGVSSTCAAMMVVAHWTPRGLTTHALYNSIFTVHAAPLLVLLLALLLLLSELGEAPPAWRPPWLPFAAWLALGLEGLAIALSLTLSSDEDLVRTRWVGLAFLPPCILVAATTLPRLRSFGPVRACDLALAFASIAQLVGLGLVMLLDFAPLLDPFAYPDLWSVGHSISGWVPEATALAAVAAALGEPRGRRGPLIPVALLALATVVPRESLLQIPASLAAIVCAGWLLVSALKRRQLPRSVGESWFAVLAALTFAEATTLGQFLRLIGTEVRLHDTYFAVGVFHLRAITCLGAALAVMYRHCPNNGQKWIIRIAGGLTIVGSQVMGLAMVSVGSRGMPRRFYNYLPEFQPWHRAIAIGGGLLILGVVFGLLGIVRPKGGTTLSTQR